MNNVTTVTTSATATTAVAPVAVGRGGGSPQVVQVKQEPAPPGNVATPKSILYSDKERKRERSKDLYR